MYQPIEILSLKDAVIYKYVYGSIYRINDLCTLHMYPMKLMYTSCKWLYM